MINLPFDGSGEISDEDLRLLNSLMEVGPGEDASEEEIEAFMSELLATPAGAEMLKSVIDQLKNSGLSTLDLSEEKSPLNPLTGTARIIARIDLVGTKPAIWRRLSFPADSTFFHLHAAIQDSFGWLTNHQHRFEIRNDQGREVEATFSSAPVEADGEEDYCEIGNRLMDLIHNGYHSFHYLYNFEANWLHHIAVEDVVPAGERETSLEFTPKVHAGEGLCPPDDCGGLTAFYELLAHGEAEENYGEELLQKLREDEFHAPAVRFRDPEKLLKQQRLGL